MKQLARLAVYAAAMVVVFTARLPDPVSTTSALRTAAPDAFLDPIRVLLAAVLVAGLVIELLRRRAVWH